MEIVCEEEKQKKIVKVTILLQCILIAIYSSILIVKPENYPALAQGFGWFALLVSFGLARLYIYQGKKVERLKDFSDGEVKSISKEYFSYYFIFYPLWVIATVGASYF